MPHRPCSDAERVPEESMAGPGFASQTPVENPESPRMYIEKNQKIDHMPYASFWTLGSRTFGPLNASKNAL